MGTGMDGLPAETADVLIDLIAQSEAHRGEQMALLHTLSGRGEGTTEALHILALLWQIAFKVAVRGRRHNAGIAGVAVG